MAIDLKAHLKSQAETANQAVAQLEADLAAARAEGIEVGRGQIQVPEEGTGEKVYTQEQMAQAVSDAVSNAKIGAQVEIDNANAALESEKSKYAEFESAQKASQVEFKKGLAKQIRDANIDNSAIADDLDKQESEG